MKWLEPSSITSLPLPTGLDEQSKAAQTRSAFVRTKALMADTFEPPWLRGAVPIILAT